MLLTMVTDDGSRVDYFVSHAGRDRAWAEWISERLVEAGLTVELDVWSWRPGDNFVLRMNEALERCDSMIMVWSRAYFEVTRQTTKEWTAVTALGMNMVPLRIEDISPPPILAPLIFEDLFDVDATQAGQRLLRAVDKRRSRPSRPAPFPHTGFLASSRLPGTLPHLCRLPPRSRSFIGRDDLLLELQSSLEQNHRTSVHALNGIGGIGKTALATEYAYRYAGRYWLIWWFNCERPTLIEEQWTALAVAAGVVERRSDGANTKEVLMTYLAEREGWLVVFDNVVRAEEIVDWIPQGSGHVIITSRSPHWRGVAAPLAVDVMKPSEAKALLADQTTNVSEETAHLIADELGHLPLALAQVSGTMAQTGISAAEVLEALRRNSLEVLSAGRPLDYPTSVAASVRLAINGLRAESPAAAEVTEACAVLGAAPIPIWLLQIAVSKIGTSTREVADQLFALRQLLALARRFGMVQFAGSDVYMHRLSREVLRTDRRSGGTDIDVELSTILLAARPATDADPAQWDKWSGLLPHLLSLPPKRRPTASEQNLLMASIWHLHVRGQETAALSLASTTRGAWSTPGRPPNLRVLRLLLYIGAIHRGLGQYDHAQRVDQNALESLRRRFGPDHGHTLAAGNNLAIDLCQLGRYDQALVIGQEVYDRRVANFGADHAEAVAAAGNLAWTYRALGRFRDAHELDLDTLGRRYSLGNDHPDVLISRSSVAADLFGLRRYEEALDIDQDVLERRRRILGEEHRYSIASACNVAGDLRRLGRHGEALDLDNGALEILQRLFEDDHPNVLTASMGLAADLSGLGRHRDAAEIIRKTHDGFTRRLGEVHPYTLAAAAVLAGELAKLGRDLEGIRLATDTLLKREQVLGVDHPVIKAWNRGPAAYDLWSDLRQEVWRTSR